MFALFYTFLYINNVVKKRVLAKPQRSSLKIHLCASERSERATELWVFNSFTVQKKGHPHPKTWGDTPIPPPPPIYASETYIQNFDGMDLWHTLQKSIFFRDYWTKSDEIFAEMQIISHISIFLKHIQVNSQFWKLLMLKVRLYFLVGWGGGTIGSI